MKANLDAFTNKMIERVLVLLSESDTSDEESAAVHQPCEDADHLDQLSRHERVDHALLPSQSLRERIERVLADHRVRLQRLAHEAARLAAGGWGNSAFRVEVEHVTREWVEAVRAIPDDPSPDDAH